MNDLIRKIAIAALAALVFIGIVAVGFAVYRDRFPETVTLPTLEEKYPSLGAPYDQDFRASGVAVRTTDRSRLPNELDLSDAVIFWATHAHLIPTVTTIPLARMGETTGLGYAPVIQDSVAIGVILKGGYTKDPRMYGCLDALNGLSGKGQVIAACDFLGDIDFLPVFRNDGGGENG